MNQEIIKLTKESIKNCEDTRSQLESRISRLAEETREAAINSKENLNKAFKAMKWKQFGKGAVGGGLLVVVILKITGVI